MPIFEYKCSRCSEVFEVLVRGNEKPICPKCKGKRLKKLISSFNAGAEKPKSVCGGCACAGQQRKRHCCQQGGCCCH